MTLKNTGKFFYDNIVLIIGLPLIVGVHWGWWQLQKNPALVDSPKHTEFPLKAIGKRYYQWAFDIDPHEPQNNPHTK